MQGTYVSVMTLFTLSKNVVIAHVLGNFVLLIDFIFVRVLFLSYLFVR